jgi:hypothetical protein
MTGSADVGYGQISPPEAASDLNAMLSIAKQVVARLNVMKPVKVVAFYPGEGDPTEAGKVDVLPLVNQVDGGGNKQEHGTVFGLPVFRLQSGWGAVICDPKVDDIGFIVVSDWDMSSVVTTKAQANPGSRRSHNLADGVYLGGILQPSPVQYLRFSEESVTLIDSRGNKYVSDADGVTITDASGKVVEISSGGIEITGNVTVNGTLEVTGNVHSQGTVTGDTDVVTGAIKLKATTGHRHTSAASGSPTSGPIV